MGFVESSTLSHEKNSSGLRHRKRQIRKNSKTRISKFCCPHDNYILMDLFSHSYNNGIDSGYLFVPLKFYVLWLFLIQGLKV